MPIAQRTKDLCLSVTFLLLGASLMAQSDSSRLPTDTLRPPVADSALLRSVKEMTTVSVTAYKPVLQIRADRITMNVAQSPLAAADNMYEVLKRMPGVMDRQGLQFRGKNVLVLINDRPSNLSGDDLTNYLSAMPANTVEKVEIITNPAARYDAAGRAVINILLSRGKNYGASGTLNTGIGAGHYGRYNGGLSLTYREKKISLYGSYDFQHHQTAADLHSQRFINIASTIREDQHTLTGNNNQSFKGGLDYELSKTSSLGILVKGIAANRTRNVDNHSHIEYFSPATDSSSTVATNNRSSLITPSVNLYFKTAIGKKGATLNVNADLYQYDKDWKDNFITRYYDGKEQEVRAPWLLRDHSPARNSIWSFSADYAFTAKGTKVEAGIKTVFTTTDNKAHWESRDTGKWLNDEGKSNYFIYKENINAAYLSLSRSIKKFEGQAGLRAEQTNAEGNSVTLDRIDKKSYFSLFPSLDITFNASDKQQFTLSYRRKIERFGFDIVNPFIVYQSQYTYSQGNPAIQPSFSNNFEADWIFNGEWSTAVSYSHYTSVLADVFKKDVTGTALISTYDNVASANEVDLTISHTKALFSGKLTLNNTAGGLYARYKAPAGSQLDKGGFAGYLMSNPVWAMGKSWKAEMNLSVNSSMKLGAYSYKPLFNMDLGVSKNILDNKGTLSFNVTDILNSYKARYTIGSFDTRSITRSEPETRFVKLAFTYRFGNKNVKAASSRPTGIEDVQRRMGQN